MLVETLITGPLEENCHIAIEPDSREAAIIDPGENATEILAAVESRGVIVRHILLTHAHFDHIGAVAAVQTATGAKVLLHRAEAPNLERAALQSAFFGFPPPAPFAVDTWLEGGEVMAIGTQRLQVLFTPGHSPGGCCFYSASQLFSGDVLFRQSIGRSDLPGGDAAQLLHSIHTLLFLLPDETVVHPGHGESTTLALEKQSNPFIRQ
ncbi:MAG TPA: MBL fold metallo-hydrolase [bacterium]|nr:MBL fold metallo-hydrolase [bacterium]